MDLIWLKSKERWTTQPCNMNISSVFGLPFSLKSHCSMYNTCSVAPQRLDRNPCPSNHRQSMPSPKPTMPLVFVCVCVCMNTCVRVMSLVLLWPPKHTYKHTHTQRLLPSGWIRWWGRRKREVGWREVLERKSESQIKSEIPAFVLLPWLQL